MFSSLLVSPIESDGLVFIGSSTDTKLYAFDEKTGATAWTYTAGGTLAVANGVVYVGSDQLYALDVKTGVKLWEYTSGVPFSFCDDSSPLVFNGVIYVGGWDHKLYTLDA